VVELYREHAPDTPILGEYQRGDTVTVLAAENNELTYVLIEEHSSFRFVTLIGLHGFRLGRTRVHNLYRYYSTV
jgi:hypothetical protein